MQRSARVRPHRALHGAADLDARWRLATLDRPRSRRTGAGAPRRPRRRSAPVRRCAATAGRRCHGARRGLSAAVSAAAAACSAPAALVVGGRRALGDAQVDRLSARRRRVGEHPRGRGPFRRQPDRRAEAQRRARRRSPRARRRARGRRARATGAAPPARRAITPHEPGLGALAEPPVAGDRVRPSRPAAACRARGAAACRRWRPPPGAPSPDTSAATGRCSRTLITSLCGRSASTDTDSHRGERLDRAPQLLLAVVERRHAHRGLAQRAADRRRVAGREAADLDLAHPHQRGVAQPAPAEPSERDHASAAKPADEARARSAARRGSPSARRAKRGSGHDAPPTGSSTSPSSCTSGSSSTPKRSRTRRRPSAISASTSAVVAAPRFSMKFACLGLKRAPPTARPLQPASSSRRPAVRPSRARRRGS